MVEICTLHSFSFLVVLNLHSIYFVFVLLNLKSLNFNAFHHNSNLQFTLALVSSTNIKSKECLRNLRNQKERILRASFKEDRARSKIVNKSAKKDIIENEVTIATDVSPIKSIAISFMTTSMIL